MKKKNKTIWERMSELIQANDPRRYQQMSPEDEALSEIYLETGKMPPPQVFDPNAEPLPEMGEVMNREPQGALEDREMMHKRARQKQTPWNQMNEPSIYILTPDGQPIPLLPEGYRELPEPLDPAPRRKKMQFMDTIA